MAQVKHLIIFRTLLVLALCMVTVLSLMPIERLPQGLDWWDKAQHALAYFILGFLAISAGTSRRYGIFLLLLLFVHGCVIELLQAVSGWRFGEWQDVMANGAGLLGIALMHSVYLSVVCKLNLSE
jgi:VanZ family protein